MPLHSTPASRRRPEIHVRRENSFTDSEGRSLTPDAEDEYEFPRDHEALDGVPPISQSPNYFQPVHEAVPSLKLSPHPPTSHSKLSHRSNPSSARLWSRTAPKERFRTAVRKIIVMHRSATMFAGRRALVGAEPGVDPRRASADVLYRGIRQDCVIEIIDYSAVRCSVSRMTNPEFLSLMEDSDSSEREPWVKVRWINIGGLSWDVIKTLSMNYDLHPLALEDIFHSRRQNRSKADYYPKHLFLQILCHELKDVDEYDERSQMLTGLPLSSSPEPMSEEDEPGDVLDEDSYRRPMKRRKRPFLPNSRLRDMEAMLDSRHSRSSFAKLLETESAISEKKIQHEISLDALKKGERVNIKLSPMFIFLFRDGTVISISPSSSDLSFTSPINKRLHQPDTGLRMSADPSLLVHALLDLIVDNVLEVVDEYHAKINKFERSILLNPQMEMVRHIHILSGDLVLHKRTLAPIKTLVYGLRRYDVDRCMALVDMSDPANLNFKVSGFMSHKSKIYLADVYDHMDYILTSLDTFALIAENLIQYTFNLVSYEMNEVMRRLTLATIIFLPLTLLTGYFGMNFETMWSTEQHSDLFFWQIALPLMAVLIPLFMMSDIKKLIRYVSKRMSTKVVVKKLKRA